jgi:2-methylcitrate dehydratase PrpD
VSVIGELATFVTTAKAPALPAAEQERLRLHLTDTVLAAIAGSSIPEGKALQRFGETRSLPDRVARCAATIRLTEIDDIHLQSCVTPSAGIVPVALMLAANSGSADATEVASAIWAGTEIATRFGMAVSGPKILYRGIWPTYLVVPVAAAATAARLFGLNAERTSHALSLAVMMTAGGVGHIHGAPSGRWFLYANAIAGGIAAADAARADYHGDPGLLDRDWLTDTHGIALDRSRLTDKLGHGSVYSELSMKPFCSAKQGIAAVQAFSSIVQAEQIRADAITRVRVFVPPAYVGMLSTRAEAGARQTTLVSVAHQIALCALAPMRLFDVDRSAATIDAAIAQLSARVEVVPDKELEAFYPLHWPAEVEVQTGGKAFRYRVTAAAGDPETPLSPSDLEDKGHRVLDPLVGAAKVDEWLMLCRNAFAGNGECGELATAFAKLAGTG